MRRQLNLRVEDEDDARIERLKARFSMNTTSLIKHLIQAADDGVEVVAVKRAASGSVDKIEVGPRKPAQVRVPSAPAKAREAVEVRVDTWPAWMKRGK